MSRRVEVICAQKYTLTNGALSKDKCGGPLEGKPTTFVLCVDADGDLRVLDNGKQNDFHLYVQEGPSRHRNERLVIAAKEDDAYLWHLRRVRHISRLPPPGVLSCEMGMCAGSARFSTRYEWSYGSSTTKS